MLFSPIRRLIARFRPGAAPSAPARQATTASAAVQTRTALRRRRIAGAAAIATATMLAVWLIVPRAGGEEVVVASDEVVAGAELTSTALTVKRFPPELVPAGAITELPAAIGATATTHVAAGAVITEHTILSPRSTALPEGRVALPVDVGDAAAAQVLKPGHHVRVFAAGGGADEGSGTDGADGDDPAARLRSGPAVVEDAVVESVRRGETGAPLDRSTVAVLIVTSEEAAALADVSDSTLSFALLN